MNKKYEKAKEILIKYKQEHIIDYINKSDDETKEKLINQVLHIDFEELKYLYDKTFESIYVDLEELEPIKAVNPDNLTDTERNDLESIGINVIKNNKFAVATMAGGQGTRLRTFRTKRNI